jgi:hypothetical protein
VASLTFILCIKVDPLIETDLLNAQIASCLAVRRARVLIGLSAPDARIEAIVAPWTAGARVSLNVLNDRSLYDGWNKAVALAATPHVVFLGYGDCVLNPLHFEHADLLGLDVLFARALVYGGDADRVQGCSFNRHIHARRQMVAMVGAIFQRELLLANPFDARLRIVGDWELLLRLGVRLRTGYRRLIVVSMLGGGLSESQFDKLMAEVRQIRAERRAR